MASYLETEVLHMLQVGLYVTTEISFILGLIIHVFIIAVYVINWRKGRAMSTADQVIISMIILRMLFQIIIQLNLFWDLLCEMCSPVYNMVIQNITFCLMYSCIWLSTLLCVVFFLKISNFRSIFLLWLKGILSKRILLLIIACLLISIGKTFLTTLVFSMSGSHDVSMNSTHGYVLQSIHNLFIMSCVNMLMPSFIFVLSSLLLIIYLSIHIKKMRRNRQVTSSLDAYYRIIKYTTGTLFTSVLFVIIGGLEQGYIYMFDLVLFAFSWTTSATLLSSLVIYVTPKLKNPFCGILKYLSDCFSKREEPRDLVMTVTTGFVDGV